MDFWSNDWFSAVSFKNKYARGGSVGAEETTILLFSCNTKLFSLIIFLYIIPFVALYLKSK